MQKYIYVLSNTCQAVKNFQIRLFGIARKSMHFYLPIIPYLCYINKSTLKNMKQNSENPFFGTYRTPFETPPFDQIETEHYEPAFDEGIRQLDEEVRAIANNAKLPTFENTIVALERSGKLLDKVSSAFFNVLNAEADDEMMDISQRVSPKLSESSNNIYLNEKLFARVKSVYDQKEELHLPTEDARLLEETFEAFSVRGAALGPENKEKYRRLSSELSLLSLTFDQNALKDKNRYELLLTKEDELEGLPESIREAAALRAKEKGKTGWLFNLSAPSYVPFMRYSALRGLREKMYREYMSVGNKGDEYDNKEIIRKIVNIRQEIANLMGHANYADYKLKHTMAKTPARVYKLLNELLEAYQTGCPKRIRGRARICFGNREKKHNGHALGLELLLRKAERYPFQRER